MFLGENPHETIGYHFANSPGQSEKLLALYNEIKKDHADLYRMGVPAFPEMWEATPLQAADRLAYETRKHLVPGGSERPMWRRLTDRSHKQHYGKYFDESGADHLMSAFAKIQ